MYIYKSNTTTLNIKHAVSYKPNKKDKKYIKKEKLLP